MFFDCADERQANAAIQFIKARRKRQSSDEQPRAASPVPLGSRKAFPGAEAAVEERLNRPIRSAKGVVAQKRAVPEIPHF